MTPKSETRSGVHKQCFLGPLLLIFLSGMSSIQSYLEKHNSVNGDLCEESKIHCNENNQQKIPLCLLRFKLLIL